jgi:hypothetical protein
MRCNLTQRNLIQLVRLATAAAAVVHARHAMHASWNGWLTAVAISACVRLVATYNGKTY